MKFLFTAGFLLLLAFTSSFAQQRYIFYLHGRIVEDQGANAHDDKNGFGDYQYNDIVEAFRAQGLIVISEVRPRNTLVEDYAQKVKRQVDSLLKKGVKPEHITVLGSSKGSSIAMTACTLLRNSKMNFVFMSACSESANPDIEFCGNILSIYEKSDGWAQSCAAFKKHSRSSMPHYKEIGLNTGLRHGYLYKPLKDWMEPAIKWAKGGYE